ncbi:hypothetical protein D3C85_1698270 [compost metagenome]
MQLQQYRHHGFGGLAGEAALAGQVEVLHQLLGQRTAALAQFTGGGVDPERAGDGLEGHTVVVEELAVFGCHQGFHQVGRHLVQLDQHAVFMVGGIEATNQ